jgi:general secretion pathway protein D
VRPSESKQTGALASSRVRTVTRPVRMVWKALVLAALLTTSPIAPPASAQPLPTELVSLDFADVELPVVVDTISRMTGYNFIYDDRVRGRVTIVSPTQVTVEQAFAVFESVLKVKGFSLVLGPGDTYKILPIRDIKESSVDTIKDDRPSPNRDRFVTRLVPLQFIDAEAITETIKPLISKDASLVAYEPTNTIIVTDSESNIRRLLSILAALDVESYRRELAVIKVEYADANTLAEQLSEIYGAEVASPSGGGETAAQRRARARRRTANNAATPDSDGGPVGPTVRILPDERTNSLLVLASRQQLADIRGLIDKLDIQVRGEGRIQVYYLRHADAEELAETLNSLVGSSGGGSASRSSTLVGSASNGVQNIRSVVTPLEDGITVTADPATNALVIKASKEGYETLKQVIEKLDVSRPQVLVEALIVEVDVTDDLTLGFDFAYRFVNGDIDLLVSTGAAVVPGTGLAAAAASKAFDNPADAFDPSADPSSDGSSLGIGMQATASDKDVNIVSAPHILTSDNEEAEIIIGDNIPIITGRTDAATGGNNLSQAVNVERQDVGVTLRVTPQISEGDTLRLNIFQEITEVSPNPAVGDPDEVGVALSNRKIENTVVVNDGETVAIGGLIDESYTETENGVPFLRDIPYLGWLFKTRSEALRKTNLLIFLTPHIIRNADDLERETIRKRLEVEDRIGNTSDFAELKEWDRASGGRDFAVHQELTRHGTRYPIERMRELEELQSAERAERNANAARAAASEAQRYAVRVATFMDESDATERLTVLLDAGYEGRLMTSESNGRLVFTLEVGPFEDLWDADRAAEALDESYGFDSSVTVLRGDEP